MKIEWIKNSGSLQGLVQAGEDAVALQGVSEDHVPRVEKFVSQFDTKSGPSFVNAVVSQGRYFAADPSDPGVIVYHGILPESESDII